jgi:hypothetical protein
MNKEVSVNLFPASKLAMITSLYGIRCSKIIVSGLSVGCNKESLLHNEELHDLYRSPTIVSVVKSRRLCWLGLGNKEWIQNFGGEISQKIFTWKTKKEMEVYH